MKYISDEAADHFSGQLEVYMRYVDICSKVAVIAFSFRQPVHIDAPIM